MLAAMFISMERCKMARIKFSFPILLCALLAGCRDSKEVALEKAVRALEQDIDRFGATMETEVIVPGIPNKQLTDRINALPDEGIQQRLRERLADYVYSIDLLKIPADKYARDVAFENYVRRFTDSGMYAKRACSFAETWRLRFRYFGWLQREIERIREKRKYPDGVSRRVTSGTGHWKCSRENWPKVLDFEYWLGLYNDLASSYEQTVGWWEMKLVSTERAYINPVELDNVAARFEKLVGRKLRSLKQCQDDLYADRRYIYPIYVATPEGIKDAWSTGEAENMMKGKPQE